METPRFVRRGDERKGDFGTVLVIGGSEVYSGAPAFNALAALAAGADLAIVVAPRRAADIVATFAPDLITVPASTRHPRLEDAAPFLSRAGSLVIGGGIERTPEAHTEIARILAATSLPVVVDAEALRAVRKEHLEGRSAILTPHPGELLALDEAGWPSDEGARRAQAEAMARAWGTALVVKGARDVVAWPGGSHVDKEGSPFLTKGGYGDLLAGAAGAFLARGLDAAQSARLATALVGRAGTLAAAKLGESTLASDALMEFPQALAVLLE